jgi:hypothetical protein
MAIIGAILAQGTIRFLDRQKREQRAAEKSINPAEPLQNRMTLRGLQDFRIRTGSKAIIRRRAKLRINRLYKKGGLVRSATARTG